MKLFKKILSSVLSFGMIFNFAFSLPVFAEGGESTSVISSSYIPKTLGECCVELDKILTPEEKEKIKQSERCFRTSYIGKLWLKPLGRMICFKWLRESRDETTALCKLLLDHGARFDREMEIKLKLFWVVLENYRHYLLTGECVPCIEDLMIDYWYYDFIFFNGDENEEQKSRRRADLERAMAKWKEKHEAYKNRWTIVSAGTIL